jgi:hypothetical protein
MIQRPYQHNVEAALMLVGLALSMELAAVAAANGLVHSSRVTS